MALDPQIPLSIAPQPSFARQAGEVYQLAGAIEKQKDEQQQRQDQQILQEGSKQEGVNMHSPDGLLKLADWAKEHGVSVKSQQIIGSALADSRKQELEMGNMLMQQSLDNNKLGVAKKGEFAEQASPVYDTWKQDKDTVGEEAANANLQKNLQPVVAQLAAKTDSSGKPYYDPKAIQEFAGAKTGKDVENSLNKIDSFRKKQQEILDAQYKQQQISESKKREQFIGKDKSGADALDVDFTELPENQQNLAKLYATKSLISGRDAPARGNAYKLQMKGMEQLAKEFDTTPAELMAAGADVKTRLAAKTQVEKRIQALDRASNQLEAEIPVMEDAMKNMSLPSLPIAARGKIIALRALGDKSVVKLDQAADAVFKEFETVISGNPGALYVTQMDDAKAKYKQIQTPDQMREWVAGARRIIKNAKEANQVTRKETMNDIMTALHFRGENDKGADKTNTGKSAAVPRGAAPTGAIEKLKQNPQLKEQFKSKYGYLPEGM